MARTRAIRGPTRVPVLRELGIATDVETLPAPAQSAPDRDRGVAILRNLLCITPGSEEDERFVTAFDELAEQTESGVSVRGVRPRDMGFVTWRLTS